MSYYKEDHPGLDLGTPGAKRPEVIVVEGKLRGSRARQLGDQLEEIASREKPGRVVLDLRNVVSLDSLGVSAIQAAVDAGLKVAAVVRPGFELAEIGLARLRVHRSVEAALGLEAALV